MNKPRIIIADTDKHYILPLQLKFIQEYFNKVDLEIITNKEYFDQLFSKLQVADILIISENLYSMAIHKHNINEIFLMTEDDQMKEFGNNVVQIYKYTNIKEIFNRIMNSSNESIIPSPVSKKDCQVILVESACGGVGKTTISLGLSACLAHNYKRTLYVNASRLQIPSSLLEEEYITSLDVYAQLRMNSRNCYSLIKNQIKNYEFNYVPLFRSALMSLGLDYSIYEELIKSAAKSGDYDFIIVDSDNVFDEIKIKLIDLADKVVLVTNQNKKSVYSLNAFLENVDISNTDKYLFVCNDFKEDKDNLNLSSLNKANYKINEYVKHIRDYDHLNVNDLTNNLSLQKITYLVM